MGKYIFSENEILGETINEPVMESDSTDVADNDSETNPTASTSLEQCAEEPKPEMVLALEKELDTEFYESETHYYSNVSVETEESEQTFIVIVDKNRKADVPIKVIPLIPSGRQIFGYKDKMNTIRANLFNVSNDSDNMGEIYLSSLRMNRIVDKYRQGEELTEDDVKNYVQEVADWTTKSSYFREKAIKRIQMEDADKHLREFDYANGATKYCREIVISDRAYAAIVAEALSRDPLETGGILLGHYKQGTWYVVESTDPGVDTYHTTVHHEMDQQYHNHIYPVVSRLYEDDLMLIGLWHRHPGNFNRFSSDDNRTNAEYAKVIEKGTLSFLINFTPQAQLTCYYLDYCNTGAYFQSKVRIGDKYFERTNFLKVASMDTLFKRRKQMKEELEESAI